MELTAEDLAIWRDYETLTIEEGALLLVGIEPRKLMQPSKADDESSSLAIQIYFDNRQRVIDGLDELPLERVEAPHWFEDFYTRGLADSVNEYIDIIKSAALGGVIETAVNVPQDNYGLDCRKTLLKKQSFIKWVRERDPDLAAALSSHLTLSPDSSTVMASNLPTSKSPSEEARKAREAHNLRGERGCRRLILEHWDKIEMLYGPNADARQAKRVVKIHCTVDDPAPELKTYQNQLGILRKEKLIP